MKKKNKEIKSSDIQTDKNIYNFFSSKLVSHSMAQLLPLSW